MNTIMDDTETLGSLGPADPVSPLLVILCATTLLAIPVAILIFLLQILPEMEIGKSAQMELYERSRAIPELRPHYAAAIADGKFTYREEGEFISEMKLAENRLLGRSN